MGSTKKTALFITASSNLLLTASGVITGILLARILGPAGRGELAAITLWPNTLLTLGGLGIPHTIAYFVARRPDQAGKVYANALVLSFFQCSLLILAGFLVIPMVLKREFVQVIPLALVYLVSIPISLLAGIHMGILQGLISMKQHSLQRLIPSVVYLSGILFIFAFHRGSLVILVTLLLLQLSVSTLSGLWFIWSKIKNRLALDWKLLREMLRYGLKTQAANSTEAFNLRLDQLVMSIFLSPQNLGYYAVAVTLSGAINPMSQAVSTITLPDVASREEGDRGRRVASILRLTSLVMVPATIILIIAMPWLLPLLFGQRFIPAAIPAQTLVVGGFFLALNGVLAEGLRGMNRPSVPAIAEGIALAVTILLLYLLLPRYGIMGAALASVIAYGTTCSIMAVSLLRCSQLSFQILIPTAEDFRALVRSVPLQAWRRGFQAAFRKV